jgi:hypothetical protein
MARKESLREGSQGAAYIVKAVEGQGHPLILDQGLSLGLGRLRLFGVFGVTKRGIYNKSVVHT